MVKLDKGDFVGREALRVKAGPARKLVGFEMIGRGIARHGYPLCDVEAARAALHERQPRPTVGKNIGLGYLPASSIAPVAHLVDCRGKIVEAEVVKSPFYKRGRA